MLTGLKVFSLTWNVYFTEQNLMYRVDSIELNFEGLKVKQTKGVDEKNGVICLVIMFNSRVKAFGMSEMANFISFLLIRAKLSSQFGQYLCVHVEDLIEFLQKMVCLIGFGRNCSWDIVGRNIKENKKC